MNNFTSISEKEILYAATYELMRKQNDEEARLQLNPNSQIAKSRIDKLDKQLREINDRIIKIEKSEQ